MASNSQLKTINEILKIDEMVVTAYQLVAEIGCVIYLKNQQSLAACSNCGCLSDKRFYPIGMLKFVSSTGNKFPFQQ
jgi:hypothetical protein